MSSRVLPFLFVVALAPRLAAQGALPVDGAGEAVTTVSRLAPAVAPAPPAEEGSTWTDARSGLMWQRAGAERDLAWKDAGDYCDANIAGLPDSKWRLPTIDELKALATKEKSKGCHWPAGLRGSCGIYWSATEASTRSEAHYVDFVTGINDFDDKGFGYHARCVRKGP